MTLHPSFLLVCGKQFGRLSGVERYPSVRVWVITTSVCSVEPACFSFLRLGGVDLSHDPFILGISPDTGWGLEYRLEER